MADASVPGPPSSRPEFHFEKRFLGAMNDGVFMTLSDWVNRSVPPDAGDLLLQMDIEGNEFDVIFETPESIWQRFRILVIEFHRLNAAFIPDANRMISLCFRKLLKSFEVVHIHPNNHPSEDGLVAACGGIQIPIAAEFTFWRRDRIRDRRPAQSFPHPLDRPDDPAMPELVLPRCFYSKRPQKLRS
jgi:hypothetical protein